MKLLSKKYFFPGVAIFFLASAKTSFAQIYTQILNDAPGAVFTVTNLINIVNGLACYFIRFGVVAVGVMTIVYGVMFLRSGGNPAGWQSAKKALLWGIVGGAVIFGVFTIILTVSSLVGYGAENYTGYPIFSVVQCI